MMPTCLIKNAFRQFETYVCWRTPSRVQACLLPDALVSAPRCVRVCSQVRSRLGPDAAASAPAFADRFWDWIVSEGGWGRMAGKTDVNNREMRCFQSCTVFFRLTRKSLSVGILSGKNQWRCGNTFRGNSGS